MAMLVSHQKVWGVPATAPTSMPGIEVAITVDDLPRFEDQPGVPVLELNRLMLRALARHGLRGVYGFVNAGKLRQHPEDRAALVAWVQAGNWLGNHTYSHAPLRSVAEFLADVEADESLLRDLEGQAADQQRRWKLLRYPSLVEGTNLETRRAIRAALASRGYRIAPVTVDFNDWAYDEAYMRCISRGDSRTTQDLERDFRQDAVTMLRWSDAAARELFGRPIPQIVLLHVGRFDAMMADSLLTGLERGGARFVSLNQALRDRVFDEEPREPRVTGGDFISQVRESRGVTVPARPLPPMARLDVLCR